MAKTRLNAGIKERLRGFAERNVSVPKEQRAFDTAYKKAGKLVTEAVRKEYPEADMVVLGKYDVTTRDRSFRVMDPTGRITGFDFERTDQLTTPRNYRHNHVFKATTACLKAVDDWGLKQDALKKARKSVLDHYLALIAASRYVEDVIEVWPASGAILRPFLDERGKNLPAAVSNETIAFVRKDNAGAEQEAA